MQYEVINIVNTLPLRLIPSEQAFEGIVLNALYNIIDFYSANIIKVDGKSISLNPKTRAHVA